MTVVQHVAVEDAVLWACTSGQGPPFVLCHGGPGLWDDLADIACAVDDLVTVHRYDQRGCGRSTGAGPYSVARSLEDMEALRRHFGYERWIVGGVSWGASLALHQALVHPERVRALVLVSSWIVVSDWRAAYKAERARRLGEHLARYEELESRERTPDEDREYVTLAWSTDFADRERSYAQAAHLLRDPSLRPNYECNAQINAETHAVDEAALLGRCRQLRVPALIVHGTDDPRPLASTDVLLEALPDARREMIEGAGHFPWVEQPEEFRAALRLFVGALASD
jgi:proline iminopeptidase